MIDEKERHIRNKICLETDNHSQTSAVDTSLYGQSPTALEIKTRARRELNFSQLQKLVKDIDRIERKSQKSQLGAGLETELAFSTINEKEGELVKMIKEQDSKFD